jgi:hypothetical protein
MACNLLTIGSTKPDTAISAAAVNTIHTITMLATLLPIVLPLPIVSLTLRTAGRQTVFDTRCPTMPTAPAFQLGLRCVLFRLEHDHI